MDALAHPHFVVDPLAKLRYFRENVWLLCIPADSDFAKGCDSDQKIKARVSRLKAILWSKNIEQGTATIACGRH